MFALAVAIVVIALIAAPARRNRAASGHLRHEGGPGHRSAPTRVVKDAPAGPYLVSIWTTGEVGEAVVHVVIDAAAGATFAPLTAVKVGVVPASGRREASWREALPAQVRRGARHSATVRFDRAERWRVQAVVARAGAADTVRAFVDVQAPVMHGPVGLVLSAVPFVLVLAVWWWAGVVRRRRATGGGPRE